MNDWLVKIFVALVVGLVGVALIVMFAFTQQGATRDFILTLAGILGAFCIAGIFAGGVRALLSQN